MIIHSYFNPHIHFKHILQTEKNYSFGGLVSDMYSKQQFCALIINSQSNTFTGCNQLYVVF